MEDPLKVVLYDGPGEIVKYDGWQPIETAPKDGTPILLFCPGSWYGDERVVGCFGSYCCSVEFYWVDLASEGMSLDKPTHWLPLPDPPFSGE